jgi:glycerophosphoryl diester phosphodiesterase
MVEVENTLPSFRRAVDEGANGLELDLNVTLDGEVIVWHDFDPTEIRARIRRWGLEPEVPYQPILPSDPQHRRPTSELLLSDVRRYFGYADKRTKERADVVIPTLTEFMEWADEEERLGLVFFDVKLPPREAKLVPRLMQRLDLLVERLRPRFRIVLESCHPEIAAELGRLGPRYGHALDVEPHPGIVFSAESCSAVKAAIKHRFRMATPQKPRSITLWPFKTHRRIVERDLELMRDHNVRAPEQALESLVSFVINDEPEMGALIDLGVSGIQSDYPGRLRKVALGRGCELEVHTEARRPPPGIMKRGGNGKKRRP